MSAPVSKQEEKWATSTAKRLLTNDIIKGHVTHDMPAKDVYMWRPKYAATKWSKFSRRLRDLQKQLKVGETKANKDAAALAHDRQLFPKKTHNTLNLPNWDQSQAQRSLKKDIDDNKHKDMKPKELYESCPEYQVFSLDVFRGHIHQEVKTRKFLTQYGQRNKQD